MLRVRKTLAIATIVLGTLTLPLFSPAAAEEPGRLDADHITDHSDVLTDAEEAELEQKLATLASADDRPELFVVLVDNFESPDNALRWADETAQANNLGSDQYLLAIATEGRSLAISAEYGGGTVKAGPLSESRVLDIEDELGADYLRTNDWAGGIAFVADEFDKVPWPWWVWVLGIAVAVALIFVVTWIVNALKRRAARAAEMRTLEGQKKVAARRLVRSDEAVRTSEQELGFVTAEFGEEATAEFRSVIDECRTRLREGFDLLEKLEDSIEDTLDETRTWTNRIIQLGDENDRALEERKRAITSLRALAEGAQRNLDRLTAERAAAANLEQDARAQLESLSSAVDSAELVGVVSNPEEISQRLRDADAELARLATAVKARKPRAISSAVHEVERLLAEAKELRDAIGAQAEALAGRSAASGTGADISGGSDPLTSVPAGPATLEQAEAAVRAAEASAQARVGTVSALALSRLNLARRQLDAARTADNAAKAQTLTDSAFGLAQQVQALISMPIASGPSRSTTTQSAGSTPHIVHHEPSPRRNWATTTASSENDGMGGRAVGGAISGGAVGLFSGFSITDGDGGAGGAVFVCVIVGVVIGALAGAFGNGGGGGGGGGSSSGWSGSSSSRRSWSSGSRSRSSSSSRSSGRSSGGGSRSSGRSGGRRF